MSGKRRRPWIVRVTTGYDIDAETGTFKQKQETLGYAATRAEGMQMLAAYNMNPFDYRNYYDSYWTPVMESLGFDHKPHDTRHTCVSMLAEAHVDTTMIKKIVGHSGAMTLTERVYTHLDVKALLEAINQI